MNSIHRSFTRRLFGACTALMLALGAWCSAAHAELLDDIVARGVLRVGTTGDYKPFSFRPTKTGDFVGFDIALAEDLAKSLGVKMQIVPTSWPTLMRDFSDNKFDIALGGVSVTLDRQKKGAFSIPYMRDGKTPITRCENQAKFSTLAQIDQPSTRLIVNPGGTNERFARASAPHAQLTVYPDNVTIFERIVEGKADLMITDASETRLQQRLHPELCAVHPDAPFDFSEKAIWLQRDWAFKAYVDQWMHQAIESGRLQKTLDHWLDYPWGLDGLRQLIDARLLLAADVARYKWNTHGAIEDKAREDQIVRSLGQQAASLGLSAPWAESFFRAQIEASKAAQREQFARWEKEGAGKFDNVADLATVIRPKLDELTPKLLQALAANARVLADPAKRDDALRLLGMLDAAALSPAAAQQAVAPFAQFGAR